MKRDGEPYVPLSPLATLIVTPCPTSVRAVLQKVAFWLSGTFCSVAPQDMELLQGGLVSLATSIAMGRKRDVCGWGGGEGRGGEKDGCCWKS